MRLLGYTGQQLSDFQDYIDAYNAAEAAASAAGIGTPGQAANAPGMTAGGGGGAADNISTPVVPEVPTPSTPVVETPITSTPVVSAPPPLPDGHIAGDTLFNNMVEAYKKLSNTSKANFFKIVELEPGAGFANWRAARTASPRTLGNPNINYVMKYVLNNQVVGASDVANNDAGVNFTKYNGGKIPSLEVLGSKYGTVPGVGGMDSVNTSLTPGEFIVRKPMVQKYGLPLLQAINSGAFKMPEIGQPTFGTGGSNRYSIPESDKAHGSETMYNNTYNVNVNVAGTDASADDIAKVVMDKISQVSRGNLRSNKY